MPEAIDEFTKAAVERFHAVDCEIAYLKGQLDAALGMLGLKSGNATTVAKSEGEIADLPNWRKDNAA